jgi:hypothetical protein
MMMSQYVSSALLDAKYQNIIKAQDVDIIFKTATMTITNHQDEQRATAAATALRASHFRLQGG